MTSLHVKTTTLQKTHLGKTRLVLTCLALHSVLLTTAHATTITVTSTGDNGPGTLRQALASAGNGDSIVFSVPIPSTIALTNGELLVTNNLTIMGPGATNLSVSGNTNSRVFNIGTNRTVSLSGLTIRDGRASSGANGGGIYNAGSLALSNCVVGFNSAGDAPSGPNAGASGGGIFNLGSLTAVGCTFRSNNGGAGGYGNSVNAFSHSLTAGGPGGNGGAIFNGGALILGSCTFNGNSGGTGGHGGNYDGGGNGAAGGIGGYGGAIYTTGSVGCTSCTFSGNRGGTGGPGGQATGVFSGGYSGSGGSGGSGGGIYNAGSAGSVNTPNGLFAFNSAGAGGTGGFGAYGIGPSGSSGSAPDLAGPFTSQGHNFVGIADGSSGIVNGSNGDIAGSTTSPVNPLLGALQDNGGPTPTMALLVGSPAIDAGDDSLTGTDQRGFTRLSGAHVDIGAFEGSVLPGESLLIGDGINNTIAQIELRSGASLGTFVLAGAGANYQIAGPRAVLCISNLLLVVNQNVNTPYNGEILKFDINTGAFLGKLVPSSNANAPYVPRGMIAGPDGTIYVADLGNFDGVYLGHVARFSLQGQYLGNLDTTGLSVPFYPMALVIGPDGMLYVSGDGNLATGEKSGYVFRFQYNSATHDFHYHDTFIASTPGNYYNPGLHNPEGLAFGPDGNLYITSFYTEFTNAQTNNIVDRDAILVFNSSGQRVGQPIYLNATNEPRAFAQALAFGPRGDLFVPISSANGVRRYSASSSYQQFTFLPLSGLVPQQPWYITFRATNPQTLAYQPPSLSAAMSGNNFEVAWPASYVGWQLQAQTNSAGILSGTNWSNVVVSVATNHISVPADSSNRAVVFRLAAP